MGPLLPPLLLLPLPLRLLLVLLPLPAFGLVVAPAVGAARADAGIAVGVLARALSEAAAFAFALPAGAAGLEAAPPLPPPLSFFSAFFALRGDELRRGERARGDDLRDGGGDAAPDGICICVHWQATGFYSGRFGAPACLKGGRGRSRAHGPAMDPVE